MKFLEKKIPKTAGELRDRISITMLFAPQRQFPEYLYMDYEGAFCSMNLGVENLRKRFGDEKANQLLEMLSQAKAHYDADEGQLGGALMEDAKMIVLKRQPWAYPKECYKWKIDDSLPELSEADLLNKEDIE